MSTRRLLVLPLLISVAVAAQAQRVSGCVCFPPPQECSTNKPAAVWTLPAPANIPVQFQRLSDNDLKNLPHINLACMTTPLEFHVHNYTQPDGGKINSPELDGQLFRLTNFEFCGCLTPQRTRRSRSPHERKIIISAKQWEKLHEETVENAKKYAKKSALE